MVVTAFNIKLPFLFLVSDRLIPGWSPPGILRGRWGLLSVRGRRRVRGPLRSSSPGPGGSSEGAGFHRSVPDDEMRSASSVSQGKYCFPKLPVSVLN